MALNRHSAPVKSGIRKAEKEQPIHGRELHADTAGRAPLGQRTRTRNSSSRRTVRPTYRYSKRGTEKKLKEFAPYSAVITESTSSHVRPEDGTLADFEADRTSAALRRQVYHGANVGCSTHSALCGRSR